MPCFAIIQGVLLRYADDVNVWKIVNIGMFARDACILYGCYTMLGSQGRLAISTWGRDDWMAIGLPVCMGVIRAMYVAGVGLDSSAKSRRGVRSVPSRMDRERTA
jgi:hypothetical protein